MWSFNLVELTHLVMLECGYDAHDPRMVVNFLHRMRKVSYSNVFNSGVYIIHSYNKRRYQHYFQDCLEKFDNI